MIGGCVRRVAVLVLVVLLGVAWLFRDPLRLAWNDIRGLRESALVATPELADRAQEKIEALRDGSAARVALSAVELESLVLYRYQGALPGFLGAPRIELQDERLRLRARLPVDKLPNVEALGEAAAFLPDTADLTVSGRLLPLDTGRVALAVDDVTAQRIPLPGRLVPGALERIGRRDESGLPPNAIALPLPPGVAAAYIRRDSLVLLARPRAGNTEN
jgi:hypothetical protein